MDIENDPEGIAEALNSAIGEGWFNGPGVARTIQRLTRAGLVWLDADGHIVVHPEVQRMTVRGEL